MADDEDMAAAIAMSLSGPPEQSSAPAAAGVEPKRKSVPTSPAEGAVNQLERNSAEALAASNAVQVLTKLLSNVAEKPDEQKFRKVNCSNEKIAKVLACDGAEALLLSAGFIKTESCLQIPETTSSADAAKGAREALDALSETWGTYMVAAQLRAHGEVRCVCALPGGGLATGAMDNTIRVYDPGYKGVPQLLRGHQSRSGVSGVRGLSASGKGPDEFASSGCDGKVLIWRSGLVQETLTGHGEGVEDTNRFVISCLSWCADGALVSGGWDKSARTWKDGKQTAILQKHTVQVNAVVGLPDGRVATGSGDTTIGIWQGGNLVRSLTTGSPVRALCSCTGSVLAAALNGGVVQLWDVVSGAKLAERRVGGDHQMALAYRAATCELAAGSAYGTLTVLRVSGTSLQVAETLQLCGGVYGLAFLENGDLAAACEDESCIVWTKSVARAESQEFRNDFAVRAAALAAASGGGGGQGGGMAAPPPAAPVGGSFGGSPDFSFPVEVADGRKLTISWNRGDDPQTVALNFARQSGGIAADELQSIVDFIRQASGMPAAPAPAMTAVPAAPPSAAMQQEALAMLMSMGFPEASARSALQAANWNVEAALDMM